MKILAIETSGREGTVALLCEGQLVAQGPLQQTGQRHAQRIVAEIGLLLEEGAVQPDQIDVVAVSQGPGSFTGLRVGYTCAKTFCYASNARLVTVPTFAVLARQAGNSEGHQTLWTLEDAQRDELFAQPWQQGHTGWQPLSDISLVDREEFQEQRSPADLLIGPVVVGWSPDLTSATLLQRPEQATPQANTVALIAESMAKAGDFADVWTAKPLYIRLSAAEEKRLREQPAAPSVTPD